MIMFDLMPMALEETNIYYRLSVISYFKYANLAILEMSLLKNKNQLIVSLTFTESELIYAMQVI